MSKSLARGVAAAGAAIVCLFLLTGRPAPASAAPAQQPAPDPAEIEKAIASARSFIYSKQNKDGTWEIVAQPDPLTMNRDVHASIRGTQYGGLTAVALYALVASGENPRDERLTKAIDFLRKVNLTGTYSLSFRILALSELPAGKENLAIMRKDAQTLVQGLIQAREAQGFYGYHSPANIAGSAKNVAKWADSSASQIAMLAIAVATEEASFEPPGNLWPTVDRAWRARQLPDGMWPYGVSTVLDEKWRKPSPGMTAAGVATLFLAQDAMRRGAGADCRPPPTDVSLDRGLAWLSANFDKLLENDKRPYWLYQAERVGFASGYRYFGQIDWFPAGARRLLATQNRKGDEAGSWGEDTYTPGRPWDGDNPTGVPDTCFGLLFLSRGRVPVAINKLSYEAKGTDRPIAGGWNLRPRDAANVSRWVGKQLEQRYKWQVVSLVGDSQDLDDAPILYLAGGNGFDFSPEDVQKLRGYVERGGMIVGNADCGKKEFADAFRKLGTAMFPRYEFRELPADHPIFSRQPYKSTAWKNKPLLLGLSNGVRELMVLIPAADAGRAWAGQMTAQSPEVHQLMANLFVYRTGKSKLRERVLPLPPTAKVPAGKDKQPAEAAMPVLKVARVEWGGNWDPEPGGWRRLAAVLSAETIADVRVSTIKSGDGKLDASFRLAHLAGTQALALPSGGWAELKAYVEGGGTLLIESVGGFASFGAAAEQQMVNELLGGDAARLVTDDAIENTLRGVALHWTAPARDRAGGRDPVIRRAKVGKGAVYFASDDLSTALTGVPADGVSGLTPASAEAVVSQLVLQAPRPATRPNPGDADAKQ